MADIRDIMGDRLRSYERFLGFINNNGDSTPPERVRNFQTGTITLQLKNHSGAPIEIIVEGTDSKGSKLWFNVDPEEDTITLSGSDALQAATYAVETTFIRVRRVSGGTGNVSVSIFVSKTLVDK